MNLLEYMQEHKEEEITVFDKDYDIETYFYGEGFNNTKDDWDKAIDKIAECLEVAEEVANKNRPCVVVNLSEVLEERLKSGVMDDLFNTRNIDAVMCDIESIFSGNVSEEWLTDFAEAFQAESCHQEKESRTADVLEM